MSPPPRANIFGILSQALFLACSWTWCIGMWFPVLMIGDWGWPGWAAFLFPNAIGAALVGLLHDEWSSRRMVAAHGTAMRAFSVVTILFHASWLVWLFWYMLLSTMRSPIEWALLSGAAAAGVVLAGGLLSMGRQWLLYALLAYAASVASALLAWRTSASLRVPPDTGTQSFQSLLFAIPVLVLGFGLCPQLDLTFHRVRQEARGLVGSAAFALGFGLLFPLLMLFTLLYAGGICAGQWSMYLCLHFAAQAAFTIGAHLRELKPGGLAELGLAWTSRRGVLVVGAMLIIASAPLVWPGVYLSRVEWTRVGYEMFMSCYALVFPAYVWIVVIDRGQPRRASITAWITACILAAPCMWIGYIERHYIWLLPAVGIVLIAPIAVKMLSRTLDRP